MEILNNNTLNIQQTRKQWWKSRRFKYNKGLVIAGITAFFTYAIVGSLLIAPYSEFEITIFTIAFQGLGYLLLMAIANLLYNLGPLADKYFNQGNNELFRQRIFNLGYWFSFGLPFLIPILLVILYFQKP